jgi:hypothetical protein
MVEVPEPLPYGVPFAREPVTPPLT